jgi:dolichol-phosphate mannosyltransferase
VVVPVFEEADNVLPLADRIAKALQAMVEEYEVIFVDDCSRDATWERIQTARQKDARVLGVRHERNLGQSAALWTGFKTSRGEIIATLDGDLQNDPADFPRMLSELDAWDMVCGVRAKRADNTVRRISSRVARWARKLALGVDFVDTGCNLRVFRKAVLETVPPFNGLHRFMPVLAHYGGARVREVPVAHHPRTAGRSKYGLWNRLGRGIRDLIMIGLYVRRQLRVYPPDRAPSGQWRERAEAAVRTGA